MRCPPLYSKAEQKKEEKKMRKGKRVAILEEENIVR